MGQGAQAQRSQSCPRLLHAGAGRGPRSPLPASPRTPLQPPGSETVLVPSLAPSSLPSSVPNTAQVVWLVLSHRPFPGARGPSLPGIRWPVSSCGDVCGLDSSPSEGHQDRLADQIRTGEAPGRGTQPPPLPAGVGYSACAPRACLGLTLRSQQPQFHGRDGPCPFRALGSPAGRARGPLWAWESST